MKFFTDASPEVVPANLTDEQVMVLETPHLKTNQFFRRLIKLMDELDAHCGTLEGDVNWEGV